MVSEKAHGIWRTKCYFSDTSVPDKTMKHPTTLNNITEKGKKNHEDQLMEEQLPDTNIQAAE
jgi:hypothetical protein